MFSTSHSGSIRGDVKSVHLSPPDRRGVLDIESPVVIWVIVRTSGEVLVEPFQKRSFLSSGEVFRAARSGQGRAVCGEANP